MTAEYEARSEYEAHMEESVDVHATEERVWGLISDPRRMPEWSPQVDSVRLRDGHDRVSVGTEFTNRNHQGDLAWATHGTIVRFDPLREFAFRIAENWVVWSFTLRPIEGGITRIVHQRLTPDGISPYSLDLTEKYVGGQAEFTRVMRAGMRETLEKVKAAAEGVAT